MASARLPLGADLRALPNRHGFLAQAVAPVFEVLGVSASLLDRAGEWHALHSAENVIAIELAHERGPERGTHNARALARVQRERTSVVAEHAGLWDAFVPVIADGELHAVLVSGPVARAADRRARICSSGGSGSPDDAGIPRTPGSCITCR